MRNRMADLPSSDVLSANCSPAVTAFAVEDADE